MEVQIWTALIGGIFIGLAIGVTLMCILQVNRTDEEPPEGI